MKKALVMSLVCAISISSAANIADSIQIQPLKSFGPPPPITPKDAITGMMENQFDRTDRTNRYYSTNALDNSADPFHFQTGFYGRNFYDSALYRVKAGNYYGIVNLHFTKANGYKDGGGNEVEFGYERFGQNFVFGGTPTENTEFRFTYMHDNIKDDQNPQTAVDSLKTERNIFRLDLRLGEADNSNTGRAVLMYRKIHRFNDTFSLPFRSKVNNPNVAMQLDRKMYDAYLSYDYSFGGWHNTAGFEFKRDDLMGKRFSHLSSGNILNAYRAPDLITDTYKFYDTISYRFSKEHLLSLGLEYEHTRAKAADTFSRVPGGTKETPAEIWKRVYGIDFDGKVKDNTFNAKLKYDFTPTDTQKYSAEIAHIERVGNDLERFSALPNGVISNPELDPEKHNFIKLTGSYKSEGYKGYMKNTTGFEVGASAMYDDIKDLIILDRARGQSGVLATTTTGTMITRNVDARMFSANLYARANFTENLGANLKAIYAYGQNKSDNRALYQIRPFEVNVALDYKDTVSFGEWSVGVAGRFVAKQSRGDFDSTTGFGFDLKEAAKSFATMDLYGSIQFKNSIGVRFGINNVFDKQYAEFISGNHVEAIPPSLVYAPGRVFWLSVHGSF